jgi:16S rRNA (cytosine967-C5)-methyltransferase
MNATPTTTLAPGTEVMALAARALTFIVTEGCTAEDALERISPPPAQRAAVRAILAGTLRWYLRLAPAIDGLIKAPGRKPQPPLHALLVVAAHQITYSRAAAESVVNIAVDATRALGLAGAAGFANAVLRRLVREAPQIFAHVDRRPAAAVAHPRWFVQALEQAYGARAPEILAANNEHPPMSLRVDLTRGSREDYLAELAAAGIAAVAGIVPCAVALIEPVGIESLPGFGEGRVSVQDAGAQVAAYLLDAQPGERILDACAAPGGKTGHILEHTAALAEVVALDSAPQRLVRVAANLARLKRSATLVAADLASPPAWWDGRPFDRVLLDAPCSATGVIRRHPDIKLLRRESDIAGLADVQLELLRSALKLLKPGGRLVYATCSVLPAENREVVERLLSEDWGGLRLLKARDLSLPPLVPRGDGEVQLLPRLKAAGPEAATDGFYYACLKSGGITDNAA